jgi:predicted nucleic acid-binding protein
VSVFVVDASLVIKWFVPEIHSEAARRWLGASHDYVAPDLLFAETGNTVWKKVRRKELEEAEGQRLMIDLAQVAVETVATRSLLQDALALALTAGITVYDAMYLSRAVGDCGLSTGGDGRETVTPRAPLVVAGSVDPFQLAAGHRRKGRGIPM